MYEVILYITLCTTWNGEQICTDKHATVYSSVTVCKRRAKAYNEMAGKEIFQCKMRERDKVEL